MKEKTAPQNISTTLIDEHFYVVVYDLNGNPKEHGVCPGSAVNWLPE